MNKISYAFVLFCMEIASCNAEPPRFRLTKNRFNNNFSARQEDLDDPNYPYPASGYRPSRLFNLPNENKSNFFDQSKNSNRNVPANPTRQYGPPPSKSTSELDNNFSGEERTENPEVESLELLASPSKQQQKDTSNVVIQGTIQPIAYVIAPQNGLENLKIQPLLVAQSLINAQQMASAIPALTPKSLVYGYTSQYQSW